VTTLAHVAEAIRTRRIPIGEACDEVIDDAILNRAAMAKRIIRPGTRTEQHSSLVAFFTKQSKEQA
jgi:hypothetical protein